MFSVILDIIILIVMFSILGKERKHKESVNHLKDDMENSFKLLEQYLEIEKKVVDTKIGALWGVPYFRRDLKYIKKENGKIGLEVTIKKDKKIKKVKQS